MCGIVGYIGPKDIDSVLLVGLQRLEYRGYDSAGITTICNGELGIRKKVGKLRVLDASLRDEPLKGNLGIGHTRWATHGEPTEANAHPHLDCQGKLAVVHNGIIENYASLKEKLIEEGHIFQSDTDTEVLSHLIEKYKAKGDGLKDAVLKTLKEVKGAYALGVISEDEPDKLIAARCGSPLIIGLGKGENIIASDAAAILNHTRQVVYLEEGQLGVITRKQVVIYDLEGQAVEIKPQTIKWDAEEIEKSGYEHFMLKEINEQPGMFKNIIRKRVANGSIELEEMGLDNEQFLKVSRIIIQACGTSWHAGLIAKYILEQYVHLHTEVDHSSEFRYRNPVVDGETLVMAITQSGETADTLAGIREAKSKFLKIFSVCNVVDSSIARESDAVIYTMAGTEIGVASTKAYTAHLAALYLFAIYLGRLKWIINDQEYKQMLDQFKKIPRLMEQMLSNNKVILECAQEYYQADNFLFLGRGLNYPSALEGALKLKEISYIHATGYPAGEMKHGPIALIDSKMPVVCIAPKGEVYEKMFSNIREVKSRQGKVIAVATEGDKEIAKHADQVIYIPEIDEIFSPILVALPLQLLAYHIA
ncbi:MAG: glutamine--fructose-6-phosphate transaminase (isomerizing), partial [Candidatus Omnitrophica bacterium]|nr:glutamine--fructose-6-phosphate transaminase (isomerizing) [Candidatus Omnitrophota bacterium]